LSVRVAVVLAIAGVGFGLLAEQLGHGFEQARGSRWRIWRPDGR